MAIKCPKCHTENPDTVKFCGECGTLIIPSSRDIQPEVTETLQTAIRELTTGSAFAGRYQIIEELGKGGMGKVYRVLDKKLNEEVALKLIKPEVASDRETLERFSNELKLARKIAHRNVGRMFELMQDEEAHFITMEYVPGEDLKSFIRRSRQLTVGTAIAIAKQVGEGLAEAHRLGVVHRDLKPSNIMIDKEGNARIMDFGIARFLKGKGITGAGVIIGTPEYMSPEQVEGKEADQRSDIYSVGIILYEMLTGRVPFEGDTPLSVAVKQKTELPPDPRQFNPQIPEAVRHLILKCLEKDKTKRYLIVEDLLSDLSGIEAGFPVAERVIPRKKPITSREITVKFNLKKIFVPAAIVLALVIVAVFFFRPSVPKLDPKRVVVAVFENKTGNQSFDSIGSIAADWITQGISRMEFLDVVPTMAMQTVMPQTIKATKELQSMAQLQALAEETSAGTVVSGAYYLVGDNLQFQARITDIRHKKLIHAVEPVSGKPDAPLETVENLRQRIMGALAGHFDMTYKAMTLPDQKITLFEAYQEYMLGNQYFATDYSKAIAHYERAVELDPDFLMPKFRIAVSYGNMGEYAKEESILQLISQKRELLTPFELNMLGWCSASLQGKNEEALSFVRKMQKIAPNFWSAGYLIGQLSLHLNRPQETVNILSKFIQKIPEWLQGHVTVTWAYNVLLDAHHICLLYTSDAADE